MKTALPLSLLLLLAVACQQSEETPGVSRTAEEAVSAPVTFTDVTDSAGIDFVHFNGAYGKTYFPELTGSGGGWLDYDGDGWMDILLVQGKHWPSDPGPDPTLRLYRNLGDGRFADVTGAAGLDVSVYGMGMSAADVDNDGDTDLLVTCVGPNRFFENRGGRFVDVTERAGLSGGEWSTSAMFVDYDRDGWLDLYICNYVEWSEETDLECSLDGETKGYCTPEIYRGEPSKLYRNRGDGTFEDVTRSAGVYTEDGKSLGVALLDFNSDGWPDIAVANDTQPDFLFENLGPDDAGAVRFREVGLASGFALDESGRARAGMGIDVGIVDETNEETIFVGNFSNEMIGVYRDLGNGSYLERAAISRIGNPSLLYLTFAVFLFDYDLDADLDLFAVNGHVQPGIEAIQQAVTFRQSSLLFENVGGGRFAERSASAGEALQRKIVGRGAAHADYDRDGDPDILIATNGGPALLLRNDRVTSADGGAPHSVRIRLIGTTVNRDAIGATVTVRAGGKTLVQTIKTGSTYLSVSELPLTAGTNGADRVDTIRVDWPNGAREVFENEAAGQSITITEARGITRREPL